MEKWRTTYSGLHIPTTWSNIIDFLEKHTSRIHYIVVSWKPLKVGLVKCNRDGSSRGIPDKSTYGFSLRYCSRDLLHAQGEFINVQT